MAEACQAGFYFNRRTEECRNCELVCGDQYGGRQQLECTETCPGYGISTTSSTTSAPADNNEKIMWIVIGSSLGLLFIIAFVLVMYFRKRMGCLLKQPKPNTIVQEESREGLVAKSAPTYA